MTEREKLDWAWAAGIFEGEGHVSHLQLPSLNGNWTRRLEVKMTDEDVIRKFGRVVQVGHIQPEYRQPPRKPVTRWQASAWLEVTYVLDHFEPYLCERRMSKVAELRSHPPTVYKQNYKGHIADVLAR